VQAFEELRNEAVDALLSTYPEFCVGVVSWALEATALNVGAQLEVLAAMTRAAYTLSASRSPAADAAVDTHVGLIEKEGETDAHIKQSKTTVRRPRRNALLKTPIVYFKNRFIPISSEFFRPVYACLQRYVKAADNRLRVSEVDKGGDGVDSMIPTQCLHALIAFIRSTVNSPIQRQMVMDTVALAGVLKESSSLSVRRCATAALCESVRMLVGRRNSIAGGETYITSALGALTSICAPSMDTVGLSNMSAEEVVLVGGLVDWCTGSYATDTDDQCRQLKADILKRAVAAFENVELF
jgi:hypothetical protein